MNLNGQEFPEDTRGQYVNKVDFGLVKADLLANYEKPQETRIDVDFEWIRFMLGPLSFKKVRGYSIRLDMQQICVSQNHWSAKATLQEEVVYLLLCKTYFYADAACSCRGRSRDHDLYSTFPGASPLTDWLESSH